VEVSGGGGEWGGGWGGCGGNGGWVGVVYDVWRGEWEQGALVNVVQFCFAKDSPWNDPKY